MTVYDKETIIRLKQNGKSWRDLGKHFGVKQEAIRAYVRKQDWYDEIKTANPDVVEEGMAFSRNEKGVYSIDSEFLFDEQKLFSDEDLLRMNNLDPEIFELLRVRRGKWSVVLKDGARKWNFQSRIDARPIEDTTVNFKALAERFVDKLAPRKVKPYIPNKGDNYLVVPLFDLHLGTNTLEDYGASVSKICSTMDKKYKEILIITGGDQLHNDNHRGTTSSGTVVDKVDMDKAWEDAFDLFDIIIDKALESAEIVGVMYIPGNHDELSGQTVFKALSKVYKNEGRISIDTRQKTFKACLLGHNFVGAAHGDKSKKAKYPMIYATSFSNIWGADGVKTREAFVGHLHHDLVGDLDGLYIRQAPTRGKTDQYHEDNGFAGAHKRIILVEYDEYEPATLYYI